MIAVLILGALIFGYLLFYKVEVIAVIFFTLTIADVNIDVPGLPMKLRAALGILLFLRVIIDPANKKMPSFFRLQSNLLLLLFIGYFFLVSWGTDSITFEIVKVLLLTIFAAYSAYFFYFKYNDYRILKTAIILSSLICFADLLYTYAVVGQFPITRIVDVYVNGGPIETDEYVEVNHNFYGCICGIAYSIILNDFLTKKNTFKFEIALMPVYFMGVLMSTSRSSLLGLIAITLMLVFYGIKDKENAKRYYKILGMSFSIIVVVIFGFIAAQSMFDLDAEFLESITYRLTEEPVAVIKKNLGYSYNVNDLDAMDWRAESAEIAYKVFVNLPTPDKLFGVGYGTYLHDNLGRNGLNPHNGILLLLIEGGILGMFIYIILLGGEMTKSLRYFRFSSLFLCVVFMIFYSLGQNEELSSATMFLFVISMSCQNYTEKVL